MWTHIREVHGHLTRHCSLKSNLVYEGLGVLETIAYCLLCRLLSRRCLPLSCNPTVSVFSVVALMVVVAVVALVHHRRKRSSQVGVGEI